MIMAEKENFQTKNVGTLKNQEHTTKEQQEKIARREKELSPKQNVLKPGDQLIIHFVIAFPRRIVQADVSGIEMGKAILMMYFYSLNYRLIQLTQEEYASIMV